MSISKHTLGIVIVFLSIFINGSPVKAQVDTDELGAWYMYFFDLKPKENTGIGFQSDIQYRNWDLGGDLEQLLLRGGITYRPKGANAKFTLGYGHITSGAYGESDETSTESRIYQEALLPHALGERVKLTHRFRYEQRWVEGQDMRTRYRYNLFLNVPINAKKFEKGTIYLALYNELFINGERAIKSSNLGATRTVELFDRNRTYGALGYVLSPKSKVQLGFMRQVNDNYGKSQVQVSLHQQF